MYNITDELYKIATCLVIDRIGDQGFISDIIEFEHHDMLCRLHLSAVIYRQTSSYPEGKITAISDIIPVWWEFHTYTGEGEEVLNTFSFNELRQYI